MKLLNINEESIKIYRAFKGFDEVEESDDFDDYYDFDMTETLLEKPENYLFVVNDDESFVDILYILKNETFNQIHPFFTGDNEREEIAFLVKEFPTYVFCFSGYVGFDLKDFGFIHCNLKSSLCEKYEYCLTSNNGYYVLNESLVDVLKDEIERVYLGNLDLSEITFKILSNEEMKDLIPFDYDKFYDGFWRQSGNHLYIGFHYFQNEFSGFYKNDSWKWVLAFDKNDNIIGVIKYGTYGEGKNAHYGLNFIDVRYDCRGKKVATRMIEFLSKNFPNEYIFILSDESDMGKECHMGDTFKKFFKENNPGVKVGFREDFYRY